MSKEQRKLERTIAVETSILLATLTRDYGIEFSAAVQGVEAALHRAYWGELPDGYRGAIVPVAPAAPKLSKALRTVLDVCAAMEREIGRASCRERVEMAEVGGAGRRSVRAG